MKHRNLARSLVTITDHKLLLNTLLCNKVKADVVFKAISV